MKIHSGGLNCNNKLSSGAKSELHQNPGTRLDIFQSPAGCLRLGARLGQNARRRAVLTCVPACLAAWSPRRERLSFQPTSRPPYILLRWLSGHLRPPFSSSTHPLANHQSTFSRNPLDKKIWALKVGSSTLPTQNPKSAYLSTQLPATFPATSGGFPTN